MGRVVRVLMKVPAVRRLMLRLANLEAATAQQQSSLDALDHHWGQLSADQASQQAKLQEAVATFERQQTRIATLSDAVHIQRAQLATLLAQQAQSATLRSVQAQQTQIDALLVQVRQLAADHEKHGATLSEVSQHLPPAQRANLEATLHGQQLQLGALNSAVNAQQMQLAALNDVVGRISSAPAIAVVDAMAGDRRELPARPAGSPGANLDEITAQQFLQLGGGKGTVYRFEDLLQRQQAPAPPLIFLHIPKAAGSTLNSLFMKNYKFRVDSRRDSFFSRYTPCELIDLASVPRSEDDRTRPGFFTGHINLDNEIFRIMPARFVSIALLRDPIERVISHYRFNSTQPSVFQDAIRDERLSVVDYCNKFSDAVTMQYRVFAPNGGLDVALRRLEHEVSFFGLQSEFDQCVDALDRLLGLSTKTNKRLNATPGSAVGVTQSEASELQSMFSDDVTFYNRAVEIYRERLTKIPKPAGEHPWTRFYS